MEYSIQALWRLSGVTTRTLRWYYDIGLLKPSRVAESGYRYYGPAEVDGLQDTTVPTLCKSSNFGSSVWADL